MALVSVEGSGSLVNVEGFSDLSGEQILVPHQDLGAIQCVVMTCGVCSAMAELRCFPSVCSQNLVPSILAVSPMYSWSHSLHLTKYTTPHCFSFLGLSLGLTNRDLKVLKGLW